MFSSFVSARNTTHNMSTPYLPPELWVSIFIHLDDPEYLLHTCRRVSRSFTTYVNTYFQTHFIPKRARIEYAPTAISPVRHIGIFSHHSADGHLASFRLSRHPKSPAPNIVNTEHQWKSPRLSIRISSPRDQRDFYVFLRCKFSITLNVFDGSDRRVVPSKWAFDSKTGIVEVEVRHLIRLRILATCRWYGI
jgi:hypothetical protein